MGLKKEIKVAKEKLCQAAEREAASREIAILEAKQWVVDEFKQCEKYKASQDYDIGYDNGYDKGVKDIFFNIWRKCHEVNYKYSGKEYQELTVVCEDQEKKGELDTRPPPSLEYSDEYYKIVGEVRIDEANDNAPTAQSSLLDDPLLIFVQFCYYFYFKV